MTKNDNFPTIASSILKTIACENLITEAELKDTVDKPLQEILDEKKSNEQGNGN